MHPSVSLFLNFYTFLEYHCKGHEQPVFKVGFFSPYEEDLDKVDPVVKCQGLAGHDGKNADAC